MNAIRKNTIVTLGRSQYRVTGNEFQNGEAVVRAIRVGGRGALGALIIFKASEITR